MITRQTRFLCSSNGGSPLLRKGVPTIILEGSKFLERKKMWSLHFDDQNVGSQKMTTDKFNLFKRLILIVTIVACLSMSGVKCSATW